MKKRAPCFVFLKFRKMNKPMWILGSIRSCWRKSHRNRSSVSRVITETTHTQTHTHTHRFYSFIKMYRYHMAICTHDCLQIPILWHLLMFLPDIKCFLKKNVRVNWKSYGRGHLKNKQPYETFVVLAVPSKNPYQNGSVFLGL